MLYTLNVYSYVRQLPLNKMGDYTFLKAEDI